MTDAELNVALMSLLVPRATVDPILSQFEGLQFLQNFDRTQQGRSPDAVVYFMKLFHRPHGWKRVTNQYVAADPVPAPPAPLGAMVVSEMQYIEQHYQFMALVPQDNEQPLLPTESDVLNAVAGIINSDRFLADLRALGVGVLRITEVRNPFFRDDKDHFAADPSFDVVFAHRRTRVDEAQVLTGYDARILRV